MATSKLAKAASLQLKGVLVEYDALCSTLIGRTAAEQAEQRRRADAVHAQQERERESQGVGLFSKMVKGMFVNDVRSMLKDLNQDATGKPWVVKDRLQSTLQGLPTDVLDRVTGDKVDQQASGKSEEELYLEKQLASASAEIERMKQQRASEKEELLRRRNGDAAGDASGARAKYLDKINKLKAKAKSRDPNQALAAFAGVSAADTAASTPAKGLTTWLVHDGANELMSYSSMRGLATAITPPQSDLQAEEFRLFCKEMQDQFDYFMPVDEYAKLPDPAPLLTAIKELELRPLEVLVIARHASTIRAAKAAGAYTCHFRKAESDIPNHSADYQLVGLTEFQYIIEEFNGISYRGRIPQWAPSQF